MNDRLELTFHRTFKFQRAPISSILELLRNGDLDHPYSKKYLLENINFGTIYAEAYPRYAIGCGLINKKTKTLSNLGVIIADNDLLIQKNETQWLLHYHLSSEYGSGPLYWNFFIKQYFCKPTQPFKRLDMYSSLRDYLGFFLNKNYSDRPMATSISVFLHSYLDVGCFDSIGLLTEISCDNFQVNQDIKISPLVFSYAASWWLSKKGEERIELTRFFSLELLNIFPLSQNDFWVLVNLIVDKGYARFEYEGESIFVRFEKSPLEYLMEIYT